MYLMLTVFFALLAAADFGPLNFKATFGPSPATFKIDVYPKFINDTRQRAALTRFPTEVPGVVPLEEGPPIGNATAVRDAWANTYDWFKVQDQLNEYNHFTTTVRPDATANYPYDVALHFVHHRSNRSDATPLLFIHGWPGSWMEVTKIIDSLTNPPNASLPAFHVVAPSIPGFGFSPAPQHDGLGPVAAGHVFQALMAQLGYDRFVIQAGDWGAAVLRVMASAYPEHVISALSNFWMRKPRASDRQALEDGSATADEAAYIRTYDNFNYNESGYRFIHQTAPLELAYALTDSPVGNAMWIDQLLQLAVTTPNFWSTEDIITWTMMYQIPGPYAGSRFYRLAQKDGFFENILDWGSPASARNIKPPIAISEFPADIWYRLPLSWAQRDGNIVKRFVHDRGGHFAATEVPELLLGDIWAFFGNSSLSNLTTSG